MCILFLLSFVVPVFANMKQILNGVVTMTVTTNFFVTAFMTKLVLKGVMIKLVVTDVMMKLVVLAYF